MDWQFDGQTGQWSVIKLTIDQLHELLVEKTKRLTASRSTANPDEYEALILLVDQIIH